MTSVAIVGGGPAGIAAAHALHRAGIPFELFDAGPPLSARRHDRAEDLGVGIGGAGLFSDGKFSFFPSGTHLYALPDRARFKAAFGAVAEMLACAGIGAPAFPGDDTAPDAALAGPFREKAYPSRYGSLAQRIRLAHGHDGCLRLPHTPAVRCRASLGRGRRVPHRLPQRGGPAVVRHLHACGARDRALRRPRRPR